MGGLLEFIIVVIIGGVIFQMFFANKDFKQYDPRGKITSKKEQDSYTPKAPERAIDETANFKNKTNVLLGQTILGDEDIFITSKELNAMCLIVGATGAGKTECIKTVLESALKNNYPIIIVDGKGAESFPDEYKEECKKYNRNFKLFSCDINNSQHYNPLRHGLYTELKDKLIDVFDWSEDYYKQQAERFLQGVFKILLLEETKQILNYEVIDLQILTKVFSFEFMKDLIPQIGEKANFMLPILKEADKKAIDGFSGRLKTLTESELGVLFEDTQDTNVIDLKESISKNDVVFFSLNSLKYAVYAQMLGRLIISDLKTVATTFKKNEK